MHAPTPPSPLLDPAVRAAIDAEKRKSAQPMDSRAGDRAWAVEVLLTRFAWTEYGFRYRRWQRETESEMAGFPFNKWKLAGIMQLIDLRTGAPVSELYPASGVGEMPEFESTGRVWVCGSINSIAALTPVGADHRSIALGRTRHSEFHNHWLLAEALVHGLEKLPPKPYQESLPYGRSTWAVDCPDQPTRQAGYSWKYFQVDQRLSHSEWNAAHWEDKKAVKARRATGRY